MGKLSILGATRVQALQVILDKERDKRLKALGEFKSVDSYSNQSLIEKALDKASITEEDISNYNALTEKLKDYDLVDNYHHSPIRKSAIRTENILSDEEKFTPEQLEFIQKKKVIRDDIANRKNQLWLCETLEEAKKIVGIE
ncbi:hypothetical protein ACNAN0_03780 [Agrilactobacillus fermenti]|uniref:hypothetical protein n=1 Tax=Agrilactobacillus fermenti TaxID=2586909 RepID=UPI003A5BEED6